MKKPILKSSILVTFLLLAFSGYSQNFLLMKKKTLTGYVDNPYYFAYSPKGTYNVVNTSGSETELRDKEFNKIWSYQGPGNGGAGRSVFTQDEKYLMFSKFQSKGDFGVLRISDQKVIQQVKAHEDYLSSIVISPDGKYIATCGNDSKIQIYQWKNESITLLQTFSTKVTEDYSEYANSLAFSPDSKYLIAGGRLGNARYNTTNEYIDGKKNEIQIYSLQGSQFKLYQTLPERFDVEELLFHPSGQYFISCTRENTALYKLQSGKFTPNRNFTDINFLGSISFSPDGKYLAGSRMTSLKVWEWNGGSLKEATENEMHRGSICTISFSPDNGYLVSTSVDKTVIIWETPNAPVAKNNIKNDTKTQPLEKKSIQPKKEESMDIDFQPSSTGKNLLLIIGINNYKYWNPLINPQKDASDVKKVLTTRYTFDPANVTEIYNDDATSKNILAKITEIKQKLTANDNLLIYFSGHGFYNADIEEGFWIPVDAHKGQETEYLPNSTLLKYIKSLPAKHVFLVADACFSGSLIAATSRGFVENVEQFKSRWGLTSGMLEFVSDGQSGKNSPFAGYFIKYLQDNQKRKFAVSELVTYVKVSVGNNSEQTPVGNPLKNVGDEGGEFVFYLK